MQHTGAQPRFVRLIPDAQEAPAKDQAASGRCVPARWPPSTRFFSGVSVRANEPAIARRIHDPEYASAHFFFFLRFAICVLRFFLCSCSAPFLFVSFLSSPLKKKGADGKRKQQKRMAAKAGYVYAIANNAMPGLVKIGATTRDPMERLHEARACTWAPPSFRLIAEAATGDAFACERAIHALLAPRRADARREFFAITHDEARTLLALVAAIGTPSPAQERLTSEPLAVAAPVAPDEKLRAWVEGHYAHVPLREKDTGTKLEALYSAYVSATPPVHMRILGKIKFAQMLGVIYAGVGPHRNSAGSASGLYLLR
jgi:hypothetical protein